MQIPEWASFFKISPDTWADLCLQAEKLKVTPLELALDMGLMNGIKFIEHERNTSGIASLREVFFNGPAPAELWKNYDYLKCRRHGCMPIGEWDNHVYWAKLSSQTVEMEGEARNAIWLLAPWTGMKKWFSQWASLHGAKPIVENKAGDSFDISMIDAKTESPSFDGPAGFKQAVSASVDSIDFSNLLSEPITTPEPKLEIEQAAPPPPPSGSTPFIDTKVEIILPGPPKKPAPAPGAAPIPKSSGQNEERTAVSKSGSEAEDVATTIMENWRNYFDKVMVLRFHGDELSIWRWNGNWPKTFARGEKIPLNTPSIFKIALDTRKPYHGYVTSGPVNDQFFKLTNTGEYPEHVTLVPLVAEGKVQAMIFGGCSKEQGKKLRLEILEENATYFAASLARVMKKAA